MNYTTHTIELAVVDFSLKMWRYLLYVVHVYIFTGHKILQYVFTEREFNILKMRWLRLVNDYDMSFL